MLSLIRSLLIKGALDYVYPNIIGTAILANHKTLEVNTMSKRHHPAQVAKVQRVLSGKRDSLLVTAYLSEARHLEKCYPVELFFQGYIRGVPGLCRFQIVKKA